MQQSCSDVAKGKICGMAKSGEMDLLINPEFLQNVANQVLIKWGKLWCVAPCSCKDLVIFPLEILGFVAYFDKLLGLQHSG